MYVLINKMRVIISQCVHLSNHHIVYLQYLTVLFVNCISVKLEGKEKFTEVGITLIQNNKKQSSTTQWSVAKYTFYSQSLKPQLFLHHSKCLFKDLIKTNQTPALTLFPPDKECLHFLNCLPKYTCMHTITRTCTHTYTAPYLTESKNLNLFLYVLYYFINIIISFNSFIKR